MKNLEKEIFDNKKKKILLLKIIVLEIVPIHPFPQVWISLVLSIFILSIYEKLKRMNFSKAPFLFSENTDLEIPADCSRFVLNRGVLQDNI